MEQGALISKLNKMIPGAVLEARPFGRSKTLSVWVETRSLYQVCLALKAESEMAFDMLENLSVVELDNALVASYFLRSTQTGNALIIRTSMAMPPAQAMVDMPSVRQVWVMAQPYEREIAELFGVRFKEDGKGEATESSRILPDGWTGYPLRKKYAFPTTVQGITHHRLPTRRGNA